MGEERGGGGEGREGRGGERRGGVRRGERAKGGRVEEGERRGRGSECQCQGGRKGMDRELTAW